MDMHNAFANATKEYKFKCRHVHTGKYVHARVYSWNREEFPQIAFAGSANYSMMGFGDSQIEVVNQCDTDLANDFYNQTSREAILCTHDSILEIVDFREEIGTKHLMEKSPVELSLLDSRTQKTHKKAGLNWGHRSSRNPDQAYTHIPSSVYKTDFFPPIKKPFLMQNDDGEEYLLVRAQENGKALQTTHDNSLPGLYFRSRIGVSSGLFADRQDLENYGRTTVSISKINDQEYFLDFSVNPKNQAS